MDAWVYIMANHYRGAMYVGATTNLRARIFAHRQGRGSRTVSERNATRLVWAETAGSVSEAIAHEKRLKRWHRDWKFALIEKNNPDWVDLFETLHLT